MFIYSMSEIKIADFNNILIPGSIWALKKIVKGYQNNQDDELATEAVIGRLFKVIKNTNFRSNSESRIQVSLLEDGYRCWFEVQDIVDQIQRENKWEPILLSKKQIIKRLPSVLGWIENASKVPNHYLWGGTSGPNFDCSGLIQTAFSSEGIWIPRDAYQQEIFCKSITFDIRSLKELLPGDLLFFGDNTRCTHVALYKGEGNYWHSSGIKNGRNGISTDTLKPINKNDISSYYLSILRGAGRVESCHDGSFIA